MQETFQVISARSSLLPVHLQLFFVSEAKVSPNYGVFVHGLSRQQPTGIEVEKWIDNSIGMFSEKVRVGN